MNYSPRRIVGMHALSKSEGKARLLGCLSKQDLLDSKVTNRHIVPRNNTGQRSGAICDLKGRTIRFIGARGTVVVFGMEEASNRRAVFARDPKIG